MGGGGLMEGWEGVGCWKGGVLFGVKGGVGGGGWGGGLVGGGGGGERKLVRRGKAGSDAFSRRVIVHR